MDNVEALEAITMALTQLHDHVGAETKRIIRLLDELALYDDYEEEVSALESGLKGAEQATLEAYYEMVKLKNMGAE